MNKRKDTDKVIRHKKSCIHAAFFMSILTTKRRIGKLVKFELAAY
jgi:hypothetical protein